MGRPMTLVRNAIPIGEWCKRIHASWQKGVESIIETGLLLKDAKAVLPRGTFEAMITSDLPFGPRAAQRLMAIANDRRIANTTHGSLLPPSWRTLYELTKLPDNVFEAKIRDGTINPKMERKHVAALLPQPKRPPKTETVSATAREISPIDHCAMQVRNVILGAMNEMDQSQWSDLIAALRDELEDIDQLAERKKANGHHAARQSA